MIGDLILNQEVNLLLMPGHPIFWDLQSVCSLKVACRGQKYFFRLGIMVVSWQGEVLHVVQQALFLFPLALDFIFAGYLCGDECVHLDILLFYMPFYQFHVTLAISRPPLFIEL